MKTANAISPSAADSFPFVTEKSDFFSMRKKEISLKTIQQSGNALLISSSRATGEKQKKPVNLYPGDYGNKPASGSHQHKHATEDPFTNSKENRSHEYRQFLFQAIKMDRARSNLIKMLVNKPESLAILATEYLSRIEQGFDPSTMLIFKCGKQNLKPVQLNIKHYESNLNQVFQQILTEGYFSAGSDEETLALIGQIHFLPAFLHLVSTVVINSAIINENLLTRIIQQRQRMIEARQMIVAGNLPLVTYTAKQYTQSKLPFSDLIQEGTIGLIKAIDRFDSQRSTKFSTYAIYWIRQAISRLITSQEKAIRIPFNTAAKSAVVFEALQMHVQKNQKWPTAVELARLCQLNVQEVETILDFSQPIVSLSSPINTDESMPGLIEMLEQRCYQSAFSDLSAQALHDILIRAMDALPKREADILMSRFGFYNDNEMTLQDIAMQLNLSRERVRQIQHDALTKIRKAYGSDLSDFLARNSV